MSHIESFTQYQQTYSDKGPIFHLHKSWNSLPKTQISDIVTMLTEGIKIIGICGQAKFLNVTQGLYYNVHANICSSSYGCSRSLFVLFCVFFFRASLVSRSVRQNRQIAFQNKFKPNPIVNVKVQKTDQHQYTKYAHIKPIYIPVTFQQHCCHHKMYYNVHGA